MVHLIDSKLFLFLFATCSPRGCCCCCSLSMSPFVWLRLKDTPPSPLVGPASRLDQLAALKQRSCPPSVFMEHTSSASSSAIFIIVFSLSSLSPFSFCSLSASPSSSSSSSSFLYITFWLILFVPSSLSSSL